jgi:2-C-methyl-D-erythritol 2,4-cyclodiphosphate synthase
VFEFTEKSGKRNGCAKLLLQEIIMRIGMGYDVHRLVRERRLVLGGVTIPFEKGLLGHSDADVLVHALCDALLGAAGLGDIGLHFPDTDPLLKDIYSIKLLAMTYEMVREKGFSIINADATVFAEAPKLAPYKNEIQKNIAQTLNVDPDLINIKATTTEGLGMIGKGEGIGAMCVVLID